MKPVAHSSLRLSAALTVDSRRALWLPEHKLLAVADLHIGYAWSHRSKGQLLPVTKQEDTVDRLLELQRDYQPEHIALLGDIVHDAVGLREVRAELDRLITLASKSQLTLILGNHDRRLTEVFTVLPEKMKMQQALPVGNFILLHGDDASAAEGVQTSQTIIMGHEHPTLALGDGITSAMRCPCFLFSEEAIVLPAFSPWANGCTVGRQPFMSPLLGETKFSEAVALMGHKLLRVPLNR